MSPYANWPKGPHTHKSVVKLLVDFAKIIESSKCFTTDLRVWMRILNVSPTFLIAIDFYWRWCTGMSDASFLHVFCIEFFAVHKQMNSSNENKLNSSQLSAITGESSICMFASHDCSNETLAVTISTLKCVQNMLHSFAPPILSWSNFELPNTIDGSHFSSMSSSKIGIPRPLFHTEISFFSASMESEYEMRFSVRRRFYGIPCTSVKSENEIRIYNVVNSGCHHIFLRTMLRELRDQRIFCIDLAVRCDAFYGMANSLFFS